MKKSKGSVVVWVIVIVVLLVAVGFAGWFFLIRKSGEGGRCKNTGKCQTGLRCVDYTCSSGKTGSVCKTYNDCQSGLYCKSSQCAQLPSYTQYFDKIKISKMKPGMPPGPNNVPVETTEFKATDGIEMDLVGVKSTTNGSFYFTLTDPVTGEVAMSGKNNKQQLSGQDRGTGTDLPVSPGKYDLNFFFNDELVYTTQITISQ